MTATVSIEMNGPYPFDEPSALSWCSVRLMRHGRRKTRCIATASGIYGQGAVYADQVDELDEISGEYADMGRAAAGSKLFRKWGRDVLFINDLCVAPTWRGHNIGPHLLRWMGSELGGVTYVFLQPTPLPTRRDDDGTWITDWEMPRAGPNARRKVLRAYRRGGFRKLQGRTWYAELHGDGREMVRVRAVMRVAGTVTS